MFEHEVDGQVVSIPDDKVQEYAKSQKWYNETLDSVREKGFLAAKQKWEAEKEELVGTYTREIENTKKSTSSKASEREEALLERFASVEKTLKEEREARLQAEKNAKLSEVKNQVTNALGDVIDDYYRRGLSRDALEAYDIETDKFTLPTGESGSLEDLVENFKVEYAPQFKSKQPNGTGINGGPVVDLPANATDEQKRIAKINAKFGANPK